jgi:hypothetical protein
LFFFNLIPILFIIISLCFIYFLNYYFFIFIPHCLILFDFHAKFDIYFFDHGF